MVSTKKKSKYDYDIVLRKLRGIGVMRQMINDLFLEIEYPVLVIPRKVSVGIKMWGMIDFLKIPWILDKK